MSALCSLAVIDRVELQRNFFAFFIRTPPHLRECLLAWFVSRSTSASYPSCAADPVTAGSASVTTARGAIDAVGAAAVVCVGGADPWGPKTVRSSAGSVLRVPVVQVDTLDDAVARLRTAGARLIEALAG